MKQIEQMRKRIDTIDKKIVCLMEKRFMISDDIGILKSRIDKPIKDPNREKDILLKLKQSEYSKELLEIYKTLFTLSKARQLKK